MTCAPAGIATLDVAPRAFSGRLESGGFGWIPKRLAMSESGAVIRLGGTHAEAVFAGFAYARCRSS